MKKLQKTTLLLVMVSSLYLVSSCTVYYKTSDVEGKLNSSIQSAIENCNHVLEQITTFENEYRELKCEGESSPYSDALAAMNEIDRSKLEMQLLQNDISKLFLDFKTYTKGKAEIASNTKEWKQFKTTKKSLKLKFKALQSTGEKTVKEAEKFNNFINESIVPLVKKVAVNAYIQNYKTSETSLLDSQKELNDKIAKLEKDLQALKSNLGRVYADKYDLLEKDLTNMKAQQNELKLVYARLVFTVDTFEHLTKGKEVIYSCSADWAIVEETEKTFSTLKESCTHIQESIIDNYAHMQKVIEEIK